MNKFMSVANEKIVEYVPPFGKEKFDSLNKKYYGLTNKDLSEISVFINDFDNVMNSIDCNSKCNYESLKPLVDAGNKIPAHCGYIVCEYYVNNNGDEKFNKILIQLHKVYSELFEQDPESTKTTDLYEMLACLIQFAPAKTLRKFIIDNFEFSKEIYRYIRKRPGTNATMSARYSELFVTSKFDSKYSDLIYNNYNMMLDFLRQKNNDIVDVHDAIRINFNQLRDIMKDYYERDKKESLKKINKLINKKADIGEAFFYWIALNPSCAMEVISQNKDISGDFIENFLFQLKIQYAAELVVLLENLPQEKLTFMNYIKTAYKLNSIDSCYDKLSNIVRNDSLPTYGILLRQSSFYPNLEVGSKSAFVDILSKLQKKLSSVANNLTAGISEKSMSITIVPLGRSRTYQDIMDKIEGNNGNSGGFAAKLRDKDIVKKIRESGLSWYTLDQYTGKVMISIMEALSDACKIHQTSEQDVVKNAYKNLVLKYGIIMTVPYFKYIITVIKSKILSNSESDVNEDYEEM